MSSSVGENVTDSVFFFFFSSLHLKKKKAWSSLYFFFFFCAEAFHAHDLNSTPVLKKIKKKKNKGTINITLCFP